MVPGIRGVQTPPFFCMRRSASATTQTEFQEVRQEVRPSAQVRARNQQPGIRHAGRHPTLMPCAAPITAYRPTNGGAVFFKRPQHTTYTEMQLPCGYCILCREEQSRQWAVRIHHETQCHQANCFVTLTYRDECLPEYGSLNYSHLHLWWRKMRRRFPGVRKYAVGEYGDKSDRPHYHVCVFGEAFLENRIVMREQPHLLWTSPLANELWGLGNVMVGDLNYQTAQYTAGYMAKKLVKGKQYVRVDEQTGELIPLVQPRAFMSKHPAIGGTWLERYGDQVYAHDRVVIAGRPQKPPRFYDRWLHGRSEIALGMIQERRKAKAKPLSEDQRRARARNARARAERRSKKL